MKRILSILLGLALALPAAAIIKSPGGSSGGGGGSGTVTSVGVASSSLTVTGFPITTSGVGDVEINPLLTANLMSAVVSAQIAVNLTATTPAYGTFTNEGIMLAPGTAVFVYGEVGAMTCGPGTTSNGTGGAYGGANPGICNGLWIVQSAAWTRPVNFPHGFVLAQNCQLTVFIQSGNLHKGHTFGFSNLGGASATIDTTILNVADRVIASATPTAAGIILTTEALPSVPVWNGTLPTVTGGCASFSDTGGGIADQGNGVATGASAPCTVGDTQGHMSAIANSGAPPVVTGTGCSLAAGGSDNAGAIVATGVDTCTVTYGVVFDAAPFCVVSGYGATVLPTISTAPTTTAVLFHTAAAGTFSYICL